MKDEGAEMRIIIGYPPLDDSRGYIQVSQNRQSKIFSVGEEAAIFPCVMAWAATMLKQDGHEVRWLDAQTQQLTEHDWNWELLEFEPDLILWEAKTPSIKATWEATRRVKDILPSCTVVLCGDHGTALPEETLEHSPTDFVLTGGDYDFGIVELVQAMEEDFFPQERVVYYTHHGELLRGTWNQPTDSTLTVLPPIDRALCRWRDYSRMGNYLYVPGTHGYSARDCWWRHEGGCTFCSWTNTYKNYRQLSVDQFMADVESAHALGAREYFDDAGTWAPPGHWFEKAVDAIARFNFMHRPRHSIFSRAPQRHHSARMAIGCNDRPGARTSQHYRAMSHAGFRFILFGLESANVETLRRINKGQHAEDMRNAAKWASEAGLQPHLTVMFGYSHESLADAENTIALIRELFDKGWANSMQATLLMPYPGTQLFKDCDEQGLLRTKDWSRYTMKEPIIKCPMTNEQVLGCIRRAYHAAITPKYILRKIITIRTRDDFRFLWRGLRFWAGHTKDFSERNAH